MSKKTVTVFGATGLQGSSLVDALLKDGFHVRGVQRSTDNDKAKKLKEKGVEVVGNDMTTSTVQQLADVMKGSYGAFLITSFWDPATMGKEEALGKKLVDAAAAAKVPHIVFSALEDVAKLTGGKLEVPHFTDKARVVDYIKTLQAKSPKAFETFSVSAPSFYYQNFEMFGMAKEEAGVVTFTMPPIRFLTAMDITELGPATAQAFVHPKKFDGKRIEYWGEHASVQSYVDTFARVTGKKAVFNSVPFDVYEKLPFPGAHELGQMYRFFNEYSYYGYDGQPFAEHSGQHNTPGGLSNYEAYLKKQHKK